MIRHNEIQQAASRRRRRSEATIVKIAVCLSSFIAIGFCGCGTSVHDKKTRRLEGYWYVVKPGDTQQSLRKNHGVNLDDLRELNGLKAGQSLRSGQRLFLFGLTKSESKPATNQTRSRVKPRKTAKIKGVRRAKRQLPPSKQKWIWPVRGARLTSKFGKRGNRPHKGIDLAKAPGAPIYAAADGVVVYSGSRQRGYGNLVILKHADGYMTVYAHNRRNLVDEGQRVRQGFQIAELGNTGRSTGPHLHFEIRHKGRPINPLRLLGKAPKR